MLIGPIEQFLCYACRFEPFVCFKYSKLLQIYQTLSLSNSKFQFLSLMIA